MKPKIYTGKYEFLNNSLSKEYVQWNNHDGDNRFLLEDPLHHVDAWQREHEGCTLIGVCYEENDYTDNAYFHPVIYEDENGNRYWTHFDIETLKEYLDMEDKDD